MLTDEQIKGFETFGLVLIREAFSLREMAAIIEANDQILASVDANESNYPVDENDNIVAPIERNDDLRPLIEDDRIYQPMAQLLGSDFIWGGSETHREIDSPERDHTWHSDRPGDPEELAYTRIKIMLYLQPMKKDHGALRVIPGSHRYPLHEQISFFQKEHLTNPNPTYFGMTGDEVPCFAVETVPGDMLMFNQSLYHGAYGKSPGRKYIALKFAARPSTDKHIHSLKQRSPGTFGPDESMVNNLSPRIQQMLEGIPKVAH